MNTLGNTAKYGTIEQVIQLLKKYGTEPYPDNQYLSNVIEQCINRLNNEGININEL